VCPEPNDVYYYYYYYLTALTVCAFSPEASAPPISEYAYNVSPLPNPPAMLVCPSMGLPPTFQSSTLPVAIFYIMNCAMHGAE